MTTRNFIYSLFISICLVPGTSFADNAMTGADWIVAGDSPLLDRSSRFLANGRNESGKRYARKALQRSNSPLKEIIGHYNLCLALNMEGDTQSAKSHCQFVRNVDKPQILLKQVRDGLYVVSGRNGASKDTIDLETVIAKNLDFYDEDRKFSQLTTVQ